ncbi:fatty acid alpha-hydroxylase SCDLUD_001276 [Saccharomycodes ludwigii]|uniref:fatty acid alpha-hydroxylase n=1 Tax=Saccharomycodes ludwigii TaxID=36035 RepID=UPI001E866DEE|nr:hypothetical protein SCDLUD_001276 [Saccharomycodes ludwigii]KAH3903631.1 hypothetical protein SCDLUD_001276 [Saccharomycodes ludwigii]
MSATTKTVPLYSATDLSKHATEKDCWVTLYNRRIYDITTFLDEHPGGKDILLDYAGKDITEVMKDLDVHEHSDSAYEILDDNYFIGVLANEEETTRLLSNPDHVVEVSTSSLNVNDGYFVKDLPTEDKLRIATDYKKDWENHKFLDLNKPLLWQVLFGKFTKEFYVDQIHRPRHYGKGSAPIFGVWFLEPLSKTPWYVIPSTWLPFVCYFFYKGVTHMNPFFSVFLFGVGLFVWTLIEYSLHRFLFHFDQNLPESQIAFTFHFLAHGVHHYLPMDKFRLVMPPALFIVLCTPIYKLVFAIFPYYWACSGFAGGLLGYICYDLTHYFLHHAKLPSYMQKLKKYHLEHHYKNYELGFGVTSWFWDKVFGTYLGDDAPTSKMKYD